MADSKKDQVDSAEQAYATAASEAKPVATDAKPAETPRPATAETKPAPAKAAPPKAKAPAKAKPAPAKTQAKTKPAAVKKTPAKGATVKAETAVKAKAPAKPAAKAKSTKTPTPKTTQPKETKPMASTPDFTASMSDAMSEMQTRAKAAYDKSTELATEMSEFSKGNMEAMVESGKILSTGMQDMGKSMVEEAKSAFETVTADMKELAAIKSPTDLFQLQSKLARRNFDSMVAMGSKASESMVKLANDAVAPLSGRMSVAAEMVSKAA